MRLPIPPPRRESGILAEAYSASNEEPEKISTRRSRAAHAASAGYARSATSASRSCDALERSRRRRSTPTDELAEARCASHPKQRDARSAARSPRMERDGEVVRTARGALLVADEARSRRAGASQGHPDGYGFLVPDDGSADLFLRPQRDARGAARRPRRGARRPGATAAAGPKATIVEVLERAQAAHRRPPAHRARRAVPRARGPAHRARHPGPAGRGRAAPRPGRS